MTKSAMPKTKAPKERGAGSAPKGRNNSAQGNALGNAALQNQSPEGATQPKQTQGYDELGNALPPSAIADSELPTGWQWVRVQEVGAVQLGRQRAPKHENGANMRPYLRVANVFEDRIDLSDVKTMNFTPSEFETFELKPNDILLNEGQSLHLVGRPALYRGELPGACFQNTLVRFRPGPKVDPKFALTIFRGYMHTGKFQKIARWTTNIAHLGASRFAEMPFPLPPLDDQRRIVAEIEKQFTRLEAGVAALRRVQANLKRYRAAVLKAACEGRLVPTEAELSRSGVPPLNLDSTAKPASSKAGSKVSTSPKRQDAASTFESGQQLLARILTERRQNWQGRGKYKEPEGPTVSTMPELPNGWTWATVDQLAAPETNSITDGPFGSNLKTEHYTSSGPRVIRLQNIGDGVYVDEEAHITQEHFERLKKHRVFANDVVIAGFGENPPRSCVIPESLGPAIVKADCIRFKPHSHVLSKYVNAALNSDPVRKRTKGMVHGVGRPRLNLGEIKSIVLPLPPLAEQTRIVAEVERRLSVVEELEAVVTTNLQRATRLRHAILQKAFTGDLA